MFKEHLILAKYFFINTIIYTDHYINDTKKNGHQPKPKTKSLVSLIVLQSHSKL